MQRLDGPLTHEFTLPFGENGEVGGLSMGRRMVIPYQVWMLQRLEDCMRPPVAVSVLRMLERVGGTEMLRLSELLDGCRLRKEGGKLYPVY